MDSPYRTARGEPAWPGCAMDPAPSVVPVVSRNAREQRMSHACAKAFDGAGGGDHLSSITRANKLGVLALGAHSLVGGVAFLRHVTLVRDPRGRRSAHNARAVQELCGHNRCAQLEVGQVHV